MATIPERAYSVVVQSDGKIVTAGLSNSGGGNNDFALVRYNSDGSLDTTFDGDGLVKTDLGGGGIDDAWDLSVQSDGKIIAAGYKSGDFVESLEAVQKALDLKDKRDKSKEIEGPLEDYDEIIKMSEELYEDIHKNPDNK